ncbi:MAG: hypothetical protein ACP5KG_12475 [Myxococcota bacterium]
MKQIAILLFIISPFFACSEGNSRNITEDIGGTTDILSYTANTEDSLYPTVEPKKEKIGIFNVVWRKGTPYERETVQSSGRDGRKRPSPSTSVTITMSGTVHIGRIPVARYSQSSDVRHGARAPYALLGRGSGSAFPSAVGVALGHGVVSSVSVACTASVCWHSTIYSDYGVTGIHLTTFVRFGA